jgi:hypothetical protein
MYNKTSFFHPTCLKLETPIQNIFHRHGDNIFFFLVHILYTQKTAHYTETNVRQNRKFALMTIAADADEKQRRGERKKLSAQFCHARSWFPV